MIKIFQRRYATKIFDTSHDIPSKDIEGICDVFRLAPSGFNLQPTRLMILNRTQISPEILEACYNQKQVATCSHLLIFCSKTLNNTYITNTLKFEQAQRPHRDSTAYHTMISKTFEDMRSFLRQEWALKQAYLSVGHLLPYIASQNIDSCVLEGFNSTKLDELLNIDLYNSMSVLLCAIGKKSKYDKEQFETKVRLPLSELILNY